MEQAGEADDDPSGLASDDGGFHRKTLEFHPRPNLRLQTPQLIVAESSVVEVEVLAEPGSAVDDMDGRAADEHQPAPRLGIVDDLENLILEVLAQQVPFEGPERLRVIRFDLGQVEHSRSASASKMFQEMFDPDPQCLLGEASRCRPEVPLVHQAEKLLTIDTKAVKVGPALKTRVQIKEI